MFMKTKMITKQRPFIMAINDSLRNSRILKGLFQHEESWILSTLKWQSTHDVKSWLIGKDPDAEKDWGQEEKGTTEDEMAGWRHRLNGHGFGWTTGVGDGQRGLVCCGSWGRKELDTTEWLNWTELNELEKNEDQTKWKRTELSKVAMELKPLYHCFMWNFRFPIILWWGLIGWHIIHLLYHMLILRMRVNTTTMF